VVVLPDACLGVAINEGLDFGTANIRFAPLTSDRIEI
jgi:hypothetical protein